MAETTLQEEKRRKKQIAEEEERLDVIGQESDKKAIKWAREDVKEKETKKQSIENTELNLLDKARKRKTAYTKTLADILFKRLSKNTYPQGYYFKVLISPQGLEVRLKDKQNNWFGRGFNVIGIPEYDLNAAAVLVIQMDNTLAICEGDAQEVGGRVAPIDKTESGLWIPPKKN